MRAVITPLKSPPALGVPVSTPVDPLSAKPIGNAPLVNVNDGAGAPVAVRLYVYGTPYVPLGGDPLVNDGAIAAAAVLVSVNSALSLPAVVYK